MVEIETHRTEVVHFKLGDALVGGVAQMQILTILPPPAISSRSDCGNSSTSRPSN